MACRSILRTGQFTLQGHHLHDGIPGQPLFESVITAMANETAARAGATDAVAAMNGAVAKAGPVVPVPQEQPPQHQRHCDVDSRGLRPPEPPKARTPLTSAEKTAAAAKAKATRAARGTTSKKAKLKVTGNVTGVTVTPITAPAAPPAATAQPATTTTK